MRKSTPGVPVPPKINKNHTRVSVITFLSNYLKKIKKDREDWIHELKHSESGFKTKRRKSRK